MRNTVFFILLISVCSPEVSCKKDIASYPARVRKGTAVKYEVIEVNAPVQLPILYLDENQLSKSESVTTGWTYAFETTKENQRMTLSATASNIRKDVLVRIYINGKKLREGLGYAVDVQYPY